MTLSDKIEQEEYHDYVEDNIIETGREILDVEDVSEFIKGTIDWLDKQIGIEQKEYCFCGGELCMRCARIETMRDVIKNIENNAGKELLE